MVSLEPSIVIWTSLTETFPFFNEMLDTYKSLSRTQAMLFPFGDHFAKETFPDPISLGIVLFEVLVVRAAVVFDCA